MKIEVKLEDKTKEASGINSGRPSLYMGGAGSGNGQWNLVWPLAVVFGLKTRYRMQKGGAKDPLVD